MNDRQARFVEEYLIDLNATQAAIRSGYSLKTAYSIGQRLLKDVEIQKAIQAAQMSLSSRAEISQEMVLAELAKIGFADIRKVAKWGPSLGVVEYEGEPVQTNGVFLVDSDDLDDDTAAAVSEISQTAQGIKIKLHDKRAALVDIGRHLGMFNDKLQIQGDKDNPLDLTLNFAPKLTREEWLQAHGLGTAARAAK